MNLLSFAVAGMVSTPSSGGGGQGKGDDPPSSAEITIVVDADTGKPQAKPESAWVAPGGDIVWKSPVPFEIVLKILWSGERVSKKSEKGKGAPDGHEFVQVTAGSVNGKYSYGIAIDGQEVDPDVVIGPKAR